jgi:hypothetical protein
MGCMRKLGLIALLAVACGATQVQAQTLKLAYSKGATYTYKAHMTLDESVNVGAQAVQVKFDMTATETQTVDSVDSMGVADLTVTLTDVKATSTVSGQTSTTATTVPAQHMKVASDGRVLSVNGLSFTGGSPFSAAGGGGPGSAILPDTAVKAGATWTKDYDQTNPFGSGTIHITSTSKYLRDETLKGTQAAVIQTTVKSPMDMTIDFSKFAQMSGGSASPIPIPGITGIAVKGSQVADVTTWLDNKAHRMLKTTTSTKVDATFSFVMAPGTSLPGLGGPYALTGTQTMDLTPV